MEMGKVDRKEKDGGREGEMASGREHGEMEMGSGEGERGEDWEAAKVGWLMLFNDTWSQ